MELGVNAFFHHPTSQVPADPAQQVAHGRGSQCRFEARLECRTANQPLDRRRDEGDQRQSKRELLCHCRFLFDLRANPPAASPDAD